ncbi:MAG: DUF6268 family outer membrane beta-barrel protein [Planctomycetia bacterium]|nr:DUF6268 family outer membrane beta-barrel protein [Planctomycetia bacterium]
MNCLKKPISRPSYYSAGMLASFSAFIPVQILAIIFILIPETISAQSAAPTLYDIATEAPSEVSASGTDWESLGTDGLSSEYNEFSSRYEDFSSTQSGFSSRYEDFSSEMNNFSSGADLSLNSGSESLSGQGLRAQPEHRNSFFQSISLDESLTTSGGGSDELGVVHVGVSAMFAAPCPGNHGSFLFSPTFALDHFYDMPDTLKKLDMADSLYRVGLNVTWLNDINDFWRVMLFVTPGVATDFETSSSDMFRLPGGGVAVWTPSPQWQFSFGLLYTAMEEWSVIPLAGATWQPNENWKFDFSFPKPKISRKADSPISALGPLWIYVAGEYSGGTWAIELAEREELATYRELRLMFGIERAKPQIGELNFQFEIGLAFCRKLEFDDSPLTYRPDVGLVERLQIKF